MLQSVQTAYSADMEPGIMTFDPFSILPDNPAVDPGPVVEYIPVEYIPPGKRIIPPSALLHGANGNNTPTKIGDGMNKILEQRRAGRMSQFTEEKAAIIIEGIEDGLTMNEIASIIGHERKVIWTWMQLSEDFHNAVTQAREYQGHAAADNAVDILDSVVIDPDNPKAAMAELRKAEQRARIRMQLAECFNNRQYGSKKQTTNTNINIEVSPVDLSRY